MIGSGCVIAIGGNENKRGARSSILGLFVRRAGGRDARIVIIPSASEEPRARAARYTRIFRGLGAQKVTTVHAERGGITEAEREALRAATGIFVTGGNQQVLMEHLRATELVEVIRTAVHDGAVYAGTSAGASAASATMIAGSDGDLVHIDEGLGLIPDVIIDQHFGERSRLPRLMLAVRWQQMRGVGIDEDTAVVWSAAGDEVAVTVAGAGKVTFVEPEHQIHVLAAK
ncbi:MAG TPA: cyanophycinase [Thermoanaerobaculia bacterium]|jgi:cyanophycinase|nr:cyanophycinase [Thermoanaerobaculia bacterium]